MKTQRFFQSLNQQLNNWRRRYKVLLRKRPLLEAVSSKNGKSRRRKLHRIVLSNIIVFLSKINDLSRAQKLGIGKRVRAKLAKSQGLLNIVGFSWVHKKRFSVVLAIAVISLTGVIGHKLYNQPKLKVGTVAPQTIKAPYTDSIENQRKTEDQRRAVSQKSMPMLMIDTSVNEQVGRNLRQLLDEGDEIRAAAGSFPFFDTSVLSLSSQRYLRSCPESEWQELLVTLETTKKQKLELFLPTQRGSFHRRLTREQDTTSSAKAGKQISAPPPSSTQKRQTQTTPLGAAPQNRSVLPSKSGETKSTNPPTLEFTQAVAELETYRITTTDRNLSSLIDQILQARQKYAQANTKLLQMEAVKPQAVYENTILLNLSDEDWVKTQVGIHDSSKRILAQGIPYGLPRDVLEAAVSLQVQTFVTTEAEPLAIKMLSVVLQPNLKQDEAETRKQAQRAANGVPAFMVQVKRGDVIVAKGENITAWNFDVLEHYHLNRREVNWLELGKVAGVVSTAVAIFVFVERQIQIQLRQRDRLLVLLLTLSVPGILTTSLPYTTWSAIGILLGSFYGPVLGVTVVSLLSLVLPTTLEIGRIALVAGAAGGIVGSCMAKRLRSREELALLGVAIATTQGGIYLMLSVFVGAAFGSRWYVVLREAAFFALSGLAWSIVALGLSPYLEKLFDLVTPIRLAELANPNRPLLKRLATETPGTFQHTLFVATLAEAAAKQLKCNVELVRAGTLYHDIGKMHDPLGFIENQMGGPNKHDTEINDPWKSAAIIKKHVTEGLVMARKHVLPTAIQAFIPEHQGTMLIAYFHHQAQQMAQANPNLTVDDADFRYDGPIPQSRETAIVMLADSCEAALRSLKDVNPEQALVMVNNILRARWQDNQMIDSGLTRDEMTKIAKIFVEVWQQFHHKRIAYPKLKTSNEKIAKH
ncbi:HD family phosphohydrolase [Calothrix sp. PCC 7507]|uniref:HD family phosphohydrolase n=1 Tax=Calothrix sp. PCC 7507 TaxID=99598 RepID=UPI00029EE159|nr:HD family phosphohydrolase [Calothrix sp. PCC 7507]AFY35105.1 7TM receptor with intracellular metal dependent phosphohydrolase [Calothrix sp. PCC 7507]